MRKFILWSILILMGMALIGHCMGSGSSTPTPTFTNSTYTAPTTIDPQVYQTVLGAQAEICTLTAQGYAPSDIVSALEQSGTSVTPAFASAIAYAATRC